MRILQTAAHMKEILEGTLSENNFHYIYVFRLLLQNVENSKKKPMCFNEI